MAHGMPAKPVWPTAPNNPMSSDTSLSITNTITVMRTTNPQRRHSHEYDIILAVVAAVDQTNAEAIPSSVSE
jgi:hypothetical protein